MEAKRYGVVIRHSLLFTLFKASVLRMGSAGHGRIDRRKLGDIS